MKNKQLLIILSLIVIIVLYLIFQNPNKTNYKLPKLQKITSTIDKIEITKSNQTITLENKDMKWTITPNDYPANNNTISKMITDSKSLNISDLISKKENYKTYDLTKLKKINVKLFSKGKLLREFDIGKTAPTYSHTFVKLKNNKNVYYAKNNFRSDFDKSIDDLRDKKIIEITKGIISDIKITKNNKSIVFIKSQEMNKKKSTGTNMISTPIEVWKNKKGKTIDKKTIDSLLDKITSLKCDKYLDNTKSLFIKTNKPIFTISLKDNSKTSSINIYKKNSDGKYPAISSYSKYAFVLSSSDADTIMKDIK